MADVRWLRLTLTLVVTVLPCCLHAEDDKATALIEKLKLDDFDERQSATEQLAALGEGARGALESALKGNSDPQVKEVARQLLSKLETASLLIMGYDRDGKPAVDAQGDLMIYRQDGKQDSQSITLAADGTARVNGLPTGYCTVNVTWKKWLPLADAATVNYGWQELKPGVNPMVAILSAGGTISADIKDKDGKPIKDAQLTIYNIGQLDPEIVDLQIQYYEMWGMRGGSSASSDAEGRIKLENVADGVYTAIIRAEGYKSGLAANFRVFEGETASVGDIVLTPRVRTKVSMLVQRAENTPLKSTKVYVTMEPVFEGPDAEKRQRKYRRLQGDIDMRQQRVAIESDENGKVTLENIDAGKYRVMLRTDNDAPQDLGLVEVKANGDAPADLGTLTFPKTGAIRGKVLGADGKPLKYVNLNAARADLGDDPRYGRYQWRNSNVTTQQDGTYEIKNLAPGKYVISAYTQSARTILLFGVEVEVGKTVDAPDIKVPEGAQRNAQANSVKGTVLLPDGRPAAGAQLMLSYASGMSNSMTNDKGEFHVQYTADNPISKISVRSAKCKAATLDLSDKALNPSDLTIRLEQQEYAVLNVRVVDETGAPVSDVGVGPRARSRNNYNAAVYKRVKTNEKGIARLTGLACGKRNLDIEKAGYYLSEPATAEIKPNLENDVTIVLKKGAVVKGTLKLPENASAANIMVGINDGGVKTVPANERGEFSLEGVSPGTYRLNVMAPGLALTKPVEVKVEESKTVEPLIVPLVRRGGVVVDLGKEQAGYTASLVPVGGEPQSSGVENVYWAWRQGGNVDAEGRAVLWGDAPGKFRLLASAPVENTRSMYGTADHVLTVQTFSDLLDLNELKSFRDLLKMQPLALKVPTGQGRIVGRLSPEKPATMSNGGWNQANLIVKIVGEKAQGTVYFNYPSEFMQGVYNAAPLVIGTPPPDFKIYAAGQFTGSGLPAGEYKITVDAAWYNYGKSQGATVNVSSQSKKQEPQVIKTFTLKEGESLDLGELKFAPPVPQEEKVQPGFEVDPEDIVPVFQP